MVRSSITAEKENVADSDIASRTSELAAQAKAQLGEDVTYMTVDLTSFKSVHQFVDRIKDMIPKGGIDVLISKKKSLVHCGYLY